MSAPARGALAAALAITTLPVVPVCRDVPPEEQRTGSVRRSDVRILLPPARIRSDVSVETALSLRRSVREFGATPLALAELSQLLWAAQGATRGGRGRTAPSAGALYPLELFVVAGSVNGLAPGVYRYRATEHALERVAEGDRRKELAAAALEQDWLARAPAALVISGVYERTSLKYGRRATRYVDFEAGAAAQNVALEAVALGLGSVVVGAFDDARVQAAAGLAPEQRPLALMPVGRD